MVMIMPVRLRWYGLVRFGFWKFHVVVVQNNGKRNVQKKCAARAFLLIRPIVVVFFFSPFSLPSPLSITRFYILFEQSINIIESFAFVLAKSIYYL